MPRARTWKDHWLGAATLAAVVAGAVAVLAFARVGALHGDTVRLYAVTPHARGILPGSEVWLAGEKVGAVRGVRFRPPGTDTALRVLLELEVLAEPARIIRRTAPVSIRAGGSFIGAPVVAIAPGTDAAPAARDGDTLVATLGNDLETLRTRITTTTGTEVPVILDNVRVLAAQLRTARGTLGAFGVEGPDRVRATATAARALADRATGGSGSVALAFGGGDLTSRARRVLARVDQLRSRAAGRDGTLGRLRADSTLPRAIAHARAELDAVRAALAEPRGTAGRLTRDEALERELNRARAEIDLLADDLRRNPLRYVTP